MAGKFEFPAWFHMPPTFTIQPVLNTKKKQMQLWIDLILDYSKATKVYEYDITEASKSPLFNNTKINRMKFLLWIYFFFFFFFFGCDVIKL
jgi:ESCRT-II complex subunit VPS25